MRSTSYKHYLLTVLTVIYAFNTVDRLALALVLQEIKIDLELSDTQLGFLGGIAFALFYALAGIPIARWADRGNRTLIITLTSALWSVAVAVCGIVGNFSQLLLTRIAVAIGEAGCVPPAVSLLADYFKRGERARTMAIYSLGPPLSAVLGFYFAGWFNDLYGWRATFIALGAPGVLLAVLALLTVREPRIAKGRSGLAELPSPTVSPRLIEVFAELWPRRAFRHLLMSFVVNSLFGSGLIHWLPAFLGRSHGLSSTQIGIGLTLAIGAGGVGTYLGGVLASRYAPNDEARQLRVVAAATLAASMLLTLTYLCADGTSALVLLTLFMFGFLTCNGPIFGALQTVVPERMRAMSFALVFFFSNLVGAGLGPLATGALSDALQPWAGGESLRYALLILTPGFFWSAWHVWRASKTVTHDIVIAQELASENPTGSSVEPVTNESENLERRAMSAPRAAG